MARVITLYVEVTHGQDMPRPICTIRKDNPDHDFFLLAHKVTEFQRLMVQGIDHDRIKFITEERNVP